MAFSGLVLGVSIALACLFQIGAAAMNRNFTFYDLLVTMEAMDRPSCNSSLGPSGINRCIWIPSVYNDYQWATCLSNTYIQRISGDRHICKNERANYCFYQCMLETYGSMGPFVYGSCSCNPGSSRAITTARPQSATIPSYCYSPDGASCNWYDACFDRATPRCTISSFGYAVEHAKNFCRTYNRGDSQLSPEGQLWVSTVSKCLQVCLASLLRQYKSPTCYEIKSQAISSRVPCYLNMGCHITSSANGSICDLPVSDIFQVSSTMSRTFVDQTTAAEFVCELLDTARQCSTQNWNYTRTCTRSYVASFVVDFTRNINTAGVDTPRFPAQIAESVAESVQLHRWHLRALGCSHTPLYMRTGRINLQIVAQDVGLCLKNLESTNPMAVSPVDFDSVTASIENAVRKGSLMFQISGVPVYITAIGECDFTECSNTFPSNATAPWPPKWSSQKSTQRGTSAVGYYTANGCSQILGSVCMAWIFSMAFFGATIVWKQNGHLFRL